MKMTAKEHYQQYGKEVTEKKLLTVLDSPDMEEGHWFEVAIDDDGITFSTAIVAHKKHIAYVDEGLLLEDFQIEVIEKLNGKLQYKSGQHWIYVPSGQETQFVKDCSKYKSAPAELVIRTLNAGKELKYGTDWDDKIRVEPEPMPEEKAEKCDCGCKVHPDDVVYSNTGKSSCQDCLAYGDDY